ncbi:hypothetical protein GCM10009696_32610 [Kocuria himachalensis]
MDTIEKPVRSKDVAAWLGLSEQALAQMRHRGTGPVYIKRGHLVFYMPSDLEQWLQEGRRETN